MLLLLGQGAGLSMTTAGHVPTEDGAVLLRPSAEELPPLLSATRKVLADINFLIAGLPAEQLREQGRAELVESLGLRSDRPWIVTAHQSRMHHAGVWFKDTVAAALAEATGGEALHVVADLDTLDNCELSVPQIGPDGLLSATSAPFAQLAERRCPAQLPPPSPETLEELIRLVEHSGLPADVFAFWSGPARSVLAGARTLAEWITAARTGVNDALGVRITHEFWSKIARRRAFARFVADIALRYRRMHEAYGQALSAYRANHGITDPLQPVPALGRRGGALELPLWAYRQSGPREPVFARHCAGSVQLLTPAGPLVRLGATDEAATDAISHLSASDVTLAPRALTLTMFLRAFIADVFIHGTGGAEYDRLGDA
ncbi:MAG: hypothetical protein HQ546_00405, partial [Planctomycetes bacterium]|nr:hypothetical protein [Planctomycetota bacterium]